VPDVPAHEAGPRRLAHHAASLALAIAFAIAGAVLSAAPAAAHAVLVGSDPADGAMLDAAPDVVELEFDEPVQATFTQVAVLDDEENHYEVGDPEVVGGTVTQAVTGVGAGEYRISYRVGSSDGHPATGVLTFTVGASGAEPAPDPAGEPAGSTDESSWMPIAVAGAAIVLAATAGLIIARRRTPPTDVDDPTAQTGRS
jgi:methionine-rich copper-binding protein CopC